MKLDIENGKYTFVQREDGACEFYRHDEQWMDIGPGAKAIIAMACELESLRQEKAELLAWKDDAMYELTALQQVTHGLAHQGDMCWDYSRDAKAVMERAPAASLARRDHLTKAKALEDIANRPIWSTVYAAKEAVRELAGRHRTLAKEQS